MAGPVVGNAHCQHLTLNAPLNPVLNPPIDGQGDGCGRSLVWDALHSYRAAVHFDDGPGNGQPRFAAIPFPGFATTIESVKSFQSRRMACAKRSSAYRT